MGISEEKQGIIEKRARRYGGSDWAERRWRGTKELRGKVSAQTEVSFHLSSLYKLIHTSKSSKNNIGLETFKIFGGKMLRET